MFKYFAVLACIAFVAISASPARTNADEEKEIVPILKSEINKHEDGSYNVEYESGDGTKREEKATVVDAGTDEEALEVKGSYKYINDDGQEVEVFYTAGKNGFVPYGSIINPEISAVAEAAKELPKEYDEKLAISKKKE
ncbi:endocuticle structural protein SgAbd-6-like [Teleopsis dalmanni]|uniref:endocuticle structural protein SgAbd-6-like n=1 Tax=Teleopsis dalmanni TaxID=139649 RepID=UPI000D32B112|nr:endocuticle structural protein SgAbd-6-like [Teleopsis dalmanni]